MTLPKEKGEYLLTYPATRGQDCRLMAILIGIVIFLVLRSWTFWLLVLTAIIV